MKYEIFGNTLPAVTVSLEAGEAIYTESGGMTWMTDDLKMETNMKGGAFGRMFSGESLFMATYTAQSPGQSITLASTFPGSIVALELAPGREYICQKHAFLCAQPTVQLTTEIIKGLSGGFFGGEGFVLQRLKGSGMAFVELDGSIKEIELQAGQKMKVDTGNVAIYESTVGYGVERIKGFKNVLFGGEGLFLTTVTGPGKVWLQTMTTEALAKAILPFLPKSN
jgi:uncharacterized protein (TIGR00266 family)